MLGLFGAVILTYIAAIASDIHLINLITRLIDGGDVTDAELDQSDRFFILTGYAMIGALLIAFFALLVWLYRIRSNYPALGEHHARWGVGWYMGWWFVPIMNLFRPYQLMEEAWRVSLPRSVDAYLIKAPPLGWWRGCF